MKLGGNKMIEEKDDNLLFVLSQNYSKKLNINKKRKFTIVEGIKLFQIMSSNSITYSHINKT